MRLAFTTVSGWAETEWAAGRLTYNGSDYTTLGTWAVVTAPDGLGAGVWFDYDSGSRTLSLASGEPPLSGYGLWASGWGTNDIGSITNDFELDGVINWIEYALGGNPVSNDASEFLPEWNIDSDGGSNWFYYTYNRREGAADLTYTVWSGTNLVDGLSNAVPVWSVAPATNGYEIATHRVSLDADNTQFMELNIGYQE